MLGRKYIGVDLRAEQIEANRAQWDAIKQKVTCSSEQTFETTSNPEEVTPIQRVSDYCVKRDDLFQVNGAPGGKVRTCLALSRGADGLITAGSRSSPQVNIVARVGAFLGVPVRAHIPEGEMSPEVQSAALMGAEIIQHKAGYNSVIKSRAREDALKTGWREIPFGMECDEAVTQTRKQCANIPPDVFRIVMPVGSGMSLAGVLHGLDDIGRNDVKVLGVVVGADPTERLEQYAPKNWKNRVELVKSPQDYHEKAASELQGITLDFHYEGKCVPFLQKGDLLWVVGVRQTQLQNFGPVTDPNWFVGDSLVTVPTITENVDMIMSCPPYGDLEIYSTDPSDISNMTPSNFDAIYSKIIMEACNKLKNDRFAFWVVGEYRYKDGSYANLVGKTVEAFKAAGLKYYCEGVLVTVAGTLPIRAAKQFMAGRKIGKTHQNFLVFLKGDAKRATAYCGDVSSSISLENASSEPDAVENSIAD